MPLSGDPYPSVVDSPDDLRRRILNAIGNENATGSILWELDLIRKALGSPTAAAKALAGKDDREEIAHLIELVYTANRRIDDLEDGLKVARTEVEFFKLKADEWERAYRQHMKGCHDAD